MKNIVWLWLVALAMAGAEARGAIVFTNLGLSAPPAMVGLYPVSPFDHGPQAAIPDYDRTNRIPGCPIAGNLMVSANVEKRTVPATWNTWSHSYTGAVFAAIGATDLTLALPPKTRAFYFYLEPNEYGQFAISATANDGSTSGPIFVDGDSGANGFGFFTDSPAQTLTRIAIIADAMADGFAIGEFGVADAPEAIPTLTEWGLLFLGAFLALAYARKLARATA